MFNKNLLISLGVTSLASIALWFYFKEKVSKLEKKFDLMFNIFQENKKTTEILNQNLNSLTNNVYGNNNPPSNEEEYYDDDEENENQNDEDNDEDNDNRDNNNLISVSDGEANEEYYSTDSEVVSDNDGDEPITISEKETIDKTLNLENMPFSINGADLNGAEINVGANVFSMMNAVALNLNEIDVNHNLEFNIEDDNVNGDNVEDNTQDNTQDNTEDNIENLDDVEDNAENNTENNTENLDDAETSIEVIDNDIFNDVVEEINNLDDVDIHNPKTTVKMLQALAKTKNLRTRGLKKDKLIALLDKHA